MINSQSIRLLPRPSSSPPRLPRYSRSDKPPRFVVTERDTLILGDILRMRYLDREQVQRLHFSPGSASACKRRLTLLYHGRYVDRMLVQETTPGGSPRALYCLDRRGAQLLAALQGSSISRLDWRRQDNDKDTFFLAHTRDCNDAWIGFIESCGQRVWSLSWTNERELRRTLTGQRLPDPAGRRPSLLVIPDGHFQVDDGVGRYSFALELDRGTVEEKRIREKVRGYGEWLVSGAYRDRYGDDSLRVIFVVSGREPRGRVQRLKRWCEEERGRSLFWFAEKEAFDRSDPLSDPIWMVAGSSGREPLLTGAQAPSGIASRRLPAVR